PAGRTGRDVSRASRSYRVLHVSTSDGTGGADAVAGRLTAGLRERGHDAWLAVGRRSGQQPHVIDLPHDGDTGIRRWSGYSLLYDGLCRIAARHPGNGVGQIARVLRRATHAEAAESWRTGLE